MTIFKKKATDTQETKKLPMTGKVKKGFRAYCTMVIVGALALGMTTTAFAANDPLTVVNNLSDFSLRTYPCHRYDFAWLWYRAGRSFAQISRPFSESQWLPDSCGRCHYHFRQRNPYSYHRLR